ncbi:hypothetical protein FOZ61_004297, partial [Perkinsus olseni]
GLRVRGRQDSRVFWYWNALLTILVLTSGHQYIPFPVPQCEASVTESHAATTKTKSDLSRWGTSPGEHFLVMIIDNDYKREYGTEGHAKSIQLQRVDRSVDEHSMATIPRYLYRGSCE